MSSLTRSPHFKFPVSSPNSHFSNEGDYFSSPYSSSFNTGTYNTPTIESKNSVTNNSNANTNGNSNSKVGSEDKHNERRVNNTHSPNVNIPAAHNPLSFKLSPSSISARASPIQTENSKSEMTGHQKFTNSISSINSDSTLVDSQNPHTLYGSYSKRKASITSTDTLVEASQFVKEKITEEEEYEDDFVRPDSLSQQHTPKHTPTKTFGHRSTKSEAFTSATFLRDLKSNPGTGVTSLHSASSSTSSNNEIVTPNSATDFKFFTKHTSLSSSHLPQIDSTSATTASSPALPNMTVPLRVGVKKLSISADTMALRPSRFKDIKYNLPEGCKLLSMKESFRYIENWRGIVGEDGLPNLLVVDVRPFQDYCKSHVVGAVNLCLPSTLLRRATFTLDRCISTLTSDEKLLFNKYLERDEENLPTMIFYDASTDSTDSASSSVSNLSAKFANSPAWNSPIYVLQGGFKGFEKSHPTHVESGSQASMPKVMVAPNKESPSNLNPPKIHISAVSPSSLSPSSSQPSYSPSTDGTSASRGSASRFFKIKSPISSHGLTHFTLPDTSTIPFFKSRHHEEFLTSRPASTLHLSTSITTPDSHILPTWLSNVIGSDSGASVLSSKFNDLQIQERNRLNLALSRHSHTDMTPDVPCFSVGVELGRKNRYKDIFPYEHARVKIQKYSDDEGELDHDNSYINASYLSYPESKLQYIATQGPLEETIGDFWKVTYDHKIPFILSLTAQKENEVEKCAPYWESGTYSSNGIFVYVDVLEETTDFKLTPESLCECIVRRIKLTINGKPSHEVLQVQILSWPDYGALINSHDLISIVALKRYIVQKTNSVDIPMIVHCSAGCGRTGCFCTIDTVIDLLLSKNNNPTDSKEDDEKDLVYDVISGFRSQRVSMVQNLKQFILIYDTILMFKKLQATLGDDLFNWDNSRYEILDKFLESY